MGLRTTSIHAVGFALGTLVPCALVSALLAHHARPLMAIPADNSSARAAPASAADAGDRSPWRMTHVLVSTCPCSKSLADYLARRGPIDGADERVLIVGNASAGQRIFDELAPRGYGVSFVDAQALKAQFGIQGGPWLIIHAPDGRVRYAGGYASRRPAADVPDADYQDAHIVAELRAGKAVEPIEALGCSVDLSFGDLFSAPRR